MPTARPRSIALLAALLSATVVAGPLLTSALFGDTGGVAGNDFSTTDCFQARFGSRQTGTVTNSANGIQTVAIGSVDTTRAFLMFSARSNGNRPVNSTVRGRIASATSLEFVRVTDEPTPAAITIRWYVIEYACGISVQRGSASLTSTTVNIGITPVASRAQAFVTWSQTPAAADQSWDNNDALLVDLTSASNLQLRANGTNAPATVWWQVVEFTNRADIDVQRGSASMTGTATSAIATIPDAVDTDRTFVITGFQSSGTGGDIGARMLRARLSDATTITFDRSATGSPDDITEIAWQAVELRDGSRVQHGTLTFAAADPQQTATIAAVNAGRSSAFASVIAGTQSAGRTGYTTDDVVGVASFTVAVTSATQITVDRANTAAAADMAWFVVEWGGPTWWDNAYDFRTPVAITAGTAAVPSGYSVLVTLDHAALVGGGQSLASGDDLRVVYWNGSTWTELDRILGEGSSWNAAGTEIWFETQAPISAGGRDISYYLYYRNPAATNPPATRSNVFLFDDGFETGTLSNWTDRSPSMTPSDWYDPAWDYRKAITINTSQISGGPHTNFPVLVSLTDPDLQARAQADGDDILFTSSNGTTKLSHEIERYTAGTGTLVAWVRMPTLSASSNVLYMYYGNAAAASQQNATGVWDSSFDGVWHMEEIPTGSAGDITDSTSNGTNGTSAGSMGGANQVTGKANGAVDFDGTNDRINLGDIGTNPWTGLTIDMWVNPDDTGGGRYVCKSTGTATSTATFCVSGQAGATGTVRFRMATGGVGGSAATDFDTPAGPLTAVAWNHVVATWSAATAQALIYVNGTQRASLAKDGDTILDSTQSVVLANVNNTDSNYLDGKLDEVRVSSAARSSGWIATEYNNVNSPSTFSSVGPEQIPGWFGTDWGYRKLVTIDTSKIASGPHSNFPILVSVTDADLQARGQADGDDIVFTSSDGTTKLSHEIEKYTGATGELVAWVRMPTLSIAANTMYMYYGNGSAPDQQDAVNVWDSNYRGVWHLHESPTGPAPQFDDPTAVNNNGTAQGAIASGAQVAGKIGGSLTLDGTSDYISTAVSFANPQSFTLEAWVRTSSASGRKVLGFESNQTGNASASYDRHLWVGTTDGQARFGAFDGTTDVATSSGAVNDNAWHHVVGVRDDAADTVSIYVDGAFQQSVANGFAQNFTGYWRIGSYKAAGWANGGDGFFPGGVDEVRVSQTVRGSGWITTEYSNQSAPSTFHSLGSQQDQSSVQTGSVFSVATDQKRSGTYALKVAPNTNVEKWLTANGIDESGVQMDAWWRLSTVAAMEFSQGVRAGTATPINQYDSNLAGTAGWDIAKEIAGTRTQLVAPPAGQNPQAGTWTKISVLIQGTSMKVLRDGSQLVPSSGWTNVGSQLTSGTVAFRAFNVPAGQNIWIDDVTVRKLVDSEPTTSLGAEDRN